MIEPIRFQDGVLELLDQRLLPGQERWVTCRSADEAAEAIRRMVVRGAPAIGICAAYGMALAARQAAEAGTEAAARALEQAAERLLAARPTAVNLAWAVGRAMQASAAAAAEGLAPRAIAEALERLAIELHEQDISSNRALGRNGSVLVPDGARILTHCNAGALATGGYGTALGVVRAAVEEGKRVQVFADETRPFLQGARLTAWELLQDGIEVTLITDNAAGALMARGDVDLVIVGADRIARNGDVANKIGTYTVAVLAHRHGVPFYVAAPTSTIDPDCPSGAEIPIEERDPEEVLSIGDVRLAPEGAKARHIAFDVTPSDLVTAIVTEKGIARSPWETSIGNLLGLEPASAAPDDDPENAGEQPGSAGGAGDPGEPIAEEMTAEGQEAGQES